MEHPLQVQRRFDHLHRLPSGVISGLCAEIADQSAVEVERVTLAAICLRRQSHHVPVSVIWLYLRACGAQTR